MNLEEQISVVHVETADVHTLRVKLQFLLNGFPVVHITTVDAEYRSELFVSIDVVARPDDVPEVILRTFRDYKVNIDRLVVVRHDGIRHNFSITVPLGVVEFKDL